MEDPNSPDQEFELPKTREEYEQRIREAEERIISAYKDSLPHFFRNAISPVVGYTEILLANSNLSAKERVLLEAIQTAGGEVTNITDKLVKADPRITKEVAGHKIIDLDQQSPGTEQKE